MNVNDAILLDTSGTVATITFNRPEKLNALDSASLRLFIALLDRVRDEAQARVLVLTGNGRAFCSGADLGEDDPGAGAAPVDRGAGLETGYNVIVERMRAFPVPIVCAVNGVAAGAGCGFALAGDIVVAARSAYFLQPFANIGLVPDVGSTWLLPRLVGKARAMGMMLLAERVPAQTALDWGMIWHMTEDHDFADHVAETAQRLAAGPTQVYGLIRQGVAQALECAASDALAMERRHQRIAGLTDDHREGVAAFAEKRPPRFTGR